MNVVGLEICNVYRDLVVYPVERLPGLVYVGVFFLSQRVRTKMYVFKEL